MQIYRIDHIAQATGDLDGQVALMEGFFGFRLQSRWEAPDEGARGVRLAVPGSWGQHWEVIAPLGDDSPVQAFLDTNGGRPGLHHVGAEVPDLDAVAAELKGLGIEPTLGPGERWIEASLSPPSHGPGVRFRLWGPGGVPRYTQEEKVSSPGPAAPTLGVVAIDHVCQAFPDRDELARWYAELAGFVQVWRTPLEEHPDMADLVLNIPGSSICWEIIMPRGEDSFIERFWNRNGAAAHHVTFEVPDWEAAMAACAHHEVDTFDDEEGVTDGSRWKHTFIHPKKTGGILVQLFWEERPGVWVRSDKIPPPA